LHSGSERKTPGDFFFILFFFAVILSAAKDLNGRWFPVENCEQL